MDHPHLSVRAAAQVSPARRRIALGVIRRLPGHTVTVRATEAGVTVVVTETAPGGTER